MGNLKKNPDPKVWGGGGGERPWHASVTRRWAGGVAALFRFPLLFCPSASLPETGSYVAREAAGVPLLVVRNPEGGVNAFRNACRHRGMQVAEGSGCKKAFACRYHGWTYGLDGALKRVPHEGRFSRPGQIAAWPRAGRRDRWKNGIVFVTQDAPGQPLEDLPALLAPEQRLFSC